MLKISSYWSFRKGSTEEWSNNNNLIQEWHCWEMCNSSVPNLQMHEPGLSWRAPGHNHWWCSPAEALLCCHVSADAPADQTERGTEIRWYMIQYTKYITTVPVGIVTNGEQLHVSEPVTYHVLLFLLLLKARVSPFPHLSHLLFVFALFWCWRLKSMIYKYMKLYGDIRLVQ